MIEPETCVTMTEVREGVDALDRELARLIGKRFRFMDAAARIKADRGAVRDEARKADVVAKARRNAAAAGYDPETAAAFWDTLVEASIAYEFDVFDRKLNAA